MAGFGGFTSGVTGATGGQCADAPAVATALAAVGFALMTLFLAVIPWLGGLPDLSKATASLVAVLLGGVVNPGHRVAGKAWTAIALMSLAAMVSAGLAVLVVPGHASVVPALSASVAAFAGLIVDTSKITHSGAGAPATATPLPVPAQSAPTSAEA